MKKQFLSYLLPAFLLLTPFATNAGQLHVFTSDSKGFDTHTFWYDDGEEITVIDTQFVPELAELAIADIKSKSKNPITRVIITHPNPDKFNGLSVFHALGVTSIASEATAEAMPDVHDYKKYFFVKIAKKFTEDSYPKLEAIKQTFKGETKIQLKSGESISLIELKNPGVSSTQTVVRIDETGDILVGDLIHYKTHAWLEGGIIAGKPKPNIALWQKSLDELMTIENAKTVYGGRGEFAPINIAINAQKKYLAKVESITNAYINSLGDSKSEILDPENASEHYKKLQILIVDAFPDYKLPYMVTYSIYGLAQKIASGR